MDVTEIKVGFEAETLVRVVAVEGSRPYRSLEVVALGVGRPDAVRTRIAITWAALRARHLGRGFAVTSVEEARSLASALGGDDEFCGIERMQDGEDRYVTIGSCSDGCVVHIRAWAPGGDEPGWISVGFLSPASVRRDCTLRGRVGNAVAALAGRFDWTAWDPITEPAALLGALADASVVAFPQNHNGGER